MKNKAAIHQNLFDRILDTRNIYSAIFCMESYIFDKGLLDTEKKVDLFNEAGEIIETIANDLELYSALADKHNVKLIEMVISVCQQRLKGILSNKDELFCARIYFKLKKYDTNSGELKFRPLHTARLIDLICMVSILNCLMYEDDYSSWQRNLSDLSKLVPHNFFGNIPSTNVQYLFHKWQTKYKEYTENVIEHCRRYQKDHTFQTEVCLDIKNFFPSISPKLLYDYIIDKLSSTYKSDLEQLKMAVAKLLYFKLEEKNIKPWKNYYYPTGFESTEEGLYMNYGIPQGLPQSYFFGNLCMIEVKTLLLKDDIFKGDAYFYVDDSVIYVQSKLDKQAFQERIRTLNSRLKKWCHKVNQTDTDLADYVCNLYLNFHEKLCYEINFHEDDKSVFTPIDEIDNQFELIFNMSRRASQVAKFSWNMDEVDDYVTLGKLNALDTVIAQEIEKLKKQENSNDEKKQDIAKSRLKLLRRFKKFFLYRKRKLMIRETGGPDDKVIQEFKERFLNNIDDIERWFEHNDEDIFQAEYQLLIQNLSKSEAKKLSEDIKCWEISILKSQNILENELYESLFYAKDAECAFQIKSLSQDTYASLMCWAKENFSGMKNLNSDKQMDKFHDFLYRKTSISMLTMLKKGYENKIFTQFILNTSAEYQRRILNVYFSEIIGVLPSDALTFTKINSQKCRYTEMRILAYLRNKDFDLKEFEEFVKHIDEKDLSNCMGIDMGLLEVLNLFINHVRKPEWVDTLICTHRLTKGLWYNGSKFLNSYTLHNEEHAVTLINKSLELTNRIDYFVLKDVDYYILFLACYLHDISMVIHPDLGKMSSAEGKNAALISDLMCKMQIEVEKFSKPDPNDAKDSRIKDAGKFLVDVFNKVFGYFESEVRNYHAFDSAKFIRERSNELLSYLQPTILSFVAKVSESHGYDVYDVYGLKSRAKDDTISLKYLMILIRLADLLDVANDRVNYHLLRQNLRHLSLISKFHWISHLVTDRIELKTEYEANNENEKENVDKPITEKINLDLYLNFQQLTTSKNKNSCKHCSCHLEDDYIHIGIQSSNYETEGCTQKKCPILCRWMMKKHEWLIPELVALNDSSFASSTCR